MLNRKCHDSRCAAARPNDVLAVVLSSRKSAAALSLLVTNYADCWATTA